MSMLVSIRHAVQPKCECGRPADVVSDDQYLCATCALRRYLKEHARWA